MTNSKILRLPDVLDRTGLSRLAVYAMAAEGTFPRSVRLGQRAIGWRESDIDDWIGARPDTPGGGGRT